MCLFGIKGGFFWTWCTTVKGGFFLCLYGSSYCHIFGKLGFEEESLMDANVLLARAGLIELGIFGDLFASGVLRSFLFVGMAVLRVVL